MNVNQRRVFSIAGAVVGVAFAILLSLAWHQAYTANNHTRDIIKDDFCGFLTKLREGPSTPPQGKYGRELNKQFDSMYNHIDCAHWNGGTSK